MPERLHRTEGVAGGFTLQQETEIRNHALYLAGFFEAGSQAGFLKGKRTPVPYLVYSDNNEDRVRAFQEQFGWGPIRRLTRYGEYINSWSTSVFSERARRFAEIVFEPERSPRRQAFRDIISLWDISENPDDLKQAVTDYLSFPVKDRRSPPGAPSVYKELLNLPEFLAGVFEARATINPDSAYAFTVDLHTDNKLLREAIHIQYGGIEYKLPHDEHLHFSSEEALGLISLVYPYLLLRVNQVNDFISSERLLPPATKKELRRNQMRRLWKQWEEKGVKEEMIEKQKAGRRRRMENSKNSTNVDE